jgi:hypothetical protein
MGDTEKKIFHQKVGRSGKLWLSVFKTPQAQEAINRRLKSY